MKHTGGCHCGRISFTVEGTIESLLSCNCSICNKRGSLLWFVPYSQLSLKTPEKDLSTYTFNKHVIKHHFCAHCGCAPFASGIDPKSGDKTAAVNVRCLDEVNVNDFKINHFDGRNY